MKTLRWLLANPAGVDYETTILFVTQLLATEVGCRALVLDEKQMLMA